LSIFSRSALLIVEVDGSSHVNRGAADSERQAALERAGYRVLRLKNELVMTALPTDLEQIRLCLRRA
jgi:very-short-patch-repair endonuclease